MNRRFSSLWTVLPAFAIALAAGLFFILRPRPTRAAPQSSTNCCGPVHPVSQRQLDFPYYSLDSGYSSTLNLVSNSPQPIDFIIVLHDLAGDSLVSSSMTIQPDAKMAIDLASLIKSLGQDPAGSFAEGSIQIYFTGTIMPLVGQVTMTNPALHLSQEAEMTENDPGRTDIPAVLSGTWWNLGGGATAEVMVANMSANTVTADVFLDFGGQRHQSSPLVFNPNETKVISIAQLLSNLNSSPSEAPQGGITIIQRGTNPSLIAQGRVVDSATGFSSTIEFPDPARQPASALDAVGLPIGTPAGDSPYAGAGSFTPHVIARNLLGQPQTMTVTVEYPKGPAWNSANGPGGPANPEVRYAGPLKKGQPNPNEALNHPPHPDPSSLMGQLALPPLPVAAYSAVDYSLAPFMNDLPLPIEFCTIRIQYSGAPGSMIAQVSSVDARQDLVVDARTMNEGDGWTGSGSNPWRLDANTESVLYLADEGAAPARIGLSITAGGVHYFLTELSLAPGETRAINIRHLRDASIADFKGHMIPANATDGSIEWIRLDNVPVSGRLLVIGRGQGVASSYDCYNCPCPANYSMDGMVISPANFDFTPVNNYQLAAAVYYINCNGDGYYADPGSCSWSSSDTSVATVDNNGVATAVAAGTATIWAYTTGTVYQVNSSDNECIAQTVPCEGSSTATVIQITASSNTVWWFNGQTPSGYTTTLTLTALPSGATYNWSLSSGSDKAILTGQSGNTINLTGTALSTSLGDVDVEVQVSGPQINGSANLPVTVRGPYLLVPGTPYDTSDPNRVWDSYIPYTIQDNFQTNLPSSVWLNENWTTGVVIDYAGANWPRGNPGSLDVTSSAFQDRIAPPALSATPTPYPTPTGPGAGTTAVEHFGQEWRLGSETPGEGARVQTDTIQLYLDHGRHLNITSPAP